jgi:tRNA U34 5-carboxymethylaminomethyl modifying GTPase MnmE/TrmE
MDGEKTIKSVRNKIIITLIGKRFSGKTTLLNSLIFPEIIKNNNYVITYGCDIRFLPINDTILIKFYDIGEIELQPNENIIQSMSWQSHYVIYLIDPKIKESLKYLAIFEEVFKDNKKILVFNKMDQVQDNNLFTQDKNIQDFINKYKINNIFYVNSLDTNSINTFKNALFNLIREDIINRAFNNMNNEIINENLILYHKPVINFSKKINIKNE